MNRYLELFWLFAKIGVCTFGGGIAMLPILQRELVEKRDWVTDEDLSDYYAVGQCTPGIIAVNTATFVGFRRAGRLGGIAATLGVVFPSLVIIVLIAAFLQNLTDYPAVGHFFAGVRACVVALIFSSVLKLGKSNLKGAFAPALFALVLGLSLLGRYVDGLPAALAFFTDPVPLVVLAGLFGFFFYGKGEKG